MSEAPRPARLAVLVSGTGTNLAALLAAIDEDPAFGAEVVVVGTDRPGAGGLDHARAADVATVEVALADHVDRRAWEDELIARLAEHEPDVVVLAGFMRLLSGTFLARWPDRVINTHPSLLPAFRGASAVGDALAYGVKVTGSTVHLVDEEVDHGPIIAQRAVEVRDDDTEASLHERIKAIEHELLPRCVKLLSRGQVAVEGRHVRILEASK